MLSAHWEDYLEVLRSILGEHLRSESIHMGAGCALMVATEDGDMLWVC